MIEHWMNVNLLFWIIFTMIWIMIIADLDEDVFFKVIMSVFMGFLTSIMFTALFYYVSSVLGYLQFESLVKFLC
jgi:hypothetical protein